jgi:hypothetical protein
MSVISSRHQVLPFVSGKSSALTGQRMLKIGYKESKGKKAKFPPHFASVPKLASFAELAETITGKNLLAIEEYLIETLEKAQNETGKALFEKANGKLAGLDDSDIDLAAINAFLSETSSSSGRLTKELITQWFDSCLAENLAVLIAGKFKLPDSPESLKNPSVVQQINILRANFEAFSNPNAVFSELQMKNVKSGLQLSDDEEHFVQRKIIARITEMEKPIVVEEAIDLSSLMD